MEAQRIALARSGARAMILVHLNLDPALYDLSTCPCHGKRAPYSR